MNVIFNPTHLYCASLLFIVFRLDLAEGIALKGGVNLERLQSLLKQDSSSSGSSSGSPSEELSPHAYRAHSRMLPELSLGAPTCSLHVFLLPQYTCLHLFPLCQHLLIAQSSLDRLCVHRIISKGISRSGDDA